LWVLRMCDGWYSRTVADEQEVKYVVGPSKEVHYHNGKNIADVYNRARYPANHKKPGFERCVSSSRFSPLSLGSRCISC
jgi:hypothetical protein